MSTPIARRTRPRPLRFGVQGLLAVLATGVLCLLTAAPAAAHVLIETVEPNGDGTTTLTFTFDHGCEGEPTDTLHVTMPDGVEALAAGPTDGWTAHVQPGSVHWQGEPVPDGERAEFTLDVRVTGTVGQSFSFPAEQGCPSGAAYEWTDTDPAGDHPAPTFVATAATLAEAPAGSMSEPADVRLVGTGPLVAGVVVTAAVAGVGGGWFVARRRVS